MHVTIARGPDVLGRPRGPSVSAPWSACTRSRYDDWRS